VLSYAQHTDCVSYYTSHSHTSQCRVVNFSPFLFIFTSEVPYQLDGVPAFLVTPALPGGLNEKCVFGVVFLVSWGGVRLSPLSMSATNWPIVPAPDDR
jgi:hypothetical protein